MKLCPKCQKQFSDDANFCPVDAARLVPLEGQPQAATDPLAQRFDLGPRLGGGRTGAVHRAVDKQGGGAAAVKLIAPEVVALPGVAQRLERELKQLERVQSAGVARVLASGRRGDDWWLAYELLENAQTLAEAISARGPIPLDQAAHLIEVIGEALIEAAQVGVVHRDLAPKNVLFTGNEIKLINFSLPVPGDRTPGVPEFVAPEQVEGKAVDQRSNLYSLGALYYYVLTGQPVHSGTPEEVHRAHAGGTIQPPSSIAEVPGPVEAMILRALDRSPTKRFLTVRQFVDEVGRVASGDQSVRSTLPMGRAGRPKAELVQTLLGMRPNAGAPAAAAPAASSAPAAAAPAPGSSPALAPGAVMALKDAPAGATMQGVGSAPVSAPAAAPAAPAEPASVAVAAAPTAEAAPSPWAAPAAAPAPAAATPAPEPVKPAPAPEPAAAPAQAAAASPAQPSQPQRAVSQGSGAQPVAPPQVANAPSGGRRKEGSTKGKFRETLWFKKGVMDEEAAEAAAAERARTGKDAGHDRADSMPMDERYKDDGSISRSDKEKYSLRTGSTQAMGALRDNPATSGSRVSEDELISEMKAGRGKILALIGVAVVVLILIVVFVAR